MAERKTLTDRYLKGLRPAPAGRRVEVWDTRVPGFGIRIHDNEDSDPARRGKAGTITFILYAIEAARANATKRAAGEPNMTDTNTPTPEELANLPTVDELVAAIKGAITNCFPGNLIHRDTCARALMYALHRIYEGGTHPGVSFEKMVTTYARDVVADILPDMFLISMSPTFKVGDTDTCSAARLMRHSTVHTCFASASLRA